LLTEETVKTISQGMSQQKKRLLDPGEEVPSKHEGPSLLLVHATES
jgi:hypothetical protein